MDQRASPLLRRLVHRPRSWHDATDNPFESARKAPATRSLTVGSHSSLATRLNERQAALIRSLRTPLAHKAIEIVRTSASEAALMPSSSEFAVTADDSDFRLAVAAPGTSDHDEQIIFAPRRIGGGAKRRMASLAAELEAFAISASTSW